jgi:hypothetical protein
MKEEKRDQAIVCSIIYIYIYIYLFIITPMKKAINLMFGKFPMKVLPLFVREYTPISSAPRRSSAHVHPTDASDALSG